ncbi:hypothetical protein [Massilia sp. NR 4-1]|uniref:hypothetical protein n=1 Tax=Massilia sp. NR 4-1 TaxID=1678028 RepID=UPI00067CC0B1|nr:hypothetical protein [Massilia sp. NR 4-1]AKU23446.1 hypothetical protein ACZ75_20280 [Massilia sp. NR 4-1]
MKTLICLLAGALALEPAQAGEAVPADVCSTRFSSAVSDALRLQAMRQPVEEAIATLDNAKIELPSPSLASGNISYLNVTPNFAEQLDKICVLGYFTLARHGEVQALPLRVEHIEVVKTARADDPAQTVASTRIYFRVPRSDDFANGRDLRGSWRFWQRHQDLDLKVAGLAYADGQRGEVYFGRSVHLNVSSKSASLAAALLFATCFYLVAAATVPVLWRRQAGWRARGTCLLPWNITGPNGQASLSQLQMLVFTLIVATLLFYQWLRTGLLQQLSTDLLYLIGISTAGAAGSQVTSSLKKELEPAAHQYAQQLGWFTAPLIGPERKAGAGALLMSNKRFDIYKFQMLVFTFVIAAYVIASGADELGNIQISATLLTLMGMSQGAYVGGRVATDSLSALQHQLQGMQNLQERYQRSADPEVGAELRRRFRLAAQEAGAMFGNLFGRVLPEYLLDIPIDAQAAPAAA